MAQSGSSKVVRARQRVQGWWRPRARTVLCVFVLGGVLAAARGIAIADGSSTPEASLAHALAKRGLTCEAADVTWMGAPGGVVASVLGGGRAIVRASTGGEPADLYLVDVRRSPEGRLLAVGDAWNLTGTSGVDESRPVVRGSKAAYATSADGLFNGVHVLDVGGRGATRSADFTRLQRAQAAITNLQQTGQTRGVAHDTFALDPIARDVAFAWLPGGSLDVRADGHRIVVDPGTAGVSEGADYVRVVPDEQGRPGSLVTWAVDRVRAVPWVGDDRMQWIKAVAFTVLDRFRAATARGTTAEDVHDELGISAPTPASGPPPFTDPEVGWPPAPIKTPIAPALPGEGQWIALDGDRFITPTATGATPAFATSFLRPSRERPDVRVYVTLWDSRQLALHMEAGTVEPISANGEHGPGIVPRKPDVMRRLVAAFNGGFQAQHGEYGMESGGVEYLPPKPYAATVVELRDGSNGFGAWPNSAAIPDDVVGMRQNLTALVQDGRYNPWGRIWWGGTPPGWPDQIHSARSALCMTREGFGGYFYSTNISAEDLAAGMLAARCAFGIHLDMNPGHAGFEFYDVAEGGKLPPLGRPLQTDWEAEGKVSGMPGYVFRSRRMIRGMGHMLFPRYIQREARDFFYLTERPILPGAPAAGVEWRTRGLPQHGFPYAIAIATLAPGAGPGAPAIPFRLVEADPRSVRPGNGAPVVLTLSGPARGSRVLAWSHEAFLVAQKLPPDATLLVRGYDPSEAPAATARAALGVRDDDGMLVWVELPPGLRADAPTTAAMTDLLASLGCTSRMVVPGDGRALLGGTLDAAADPGAPAAPDSVSLVRGRAPDAHPVFADTPLVPVSVWQPLQAKRVRYFYKPTAAVSSSTTAPTPTEP